MWNYNMMIPSFLVMAIFVIYFFASSRLPIRLNRTFLWLIIAELLTTLFDLLACFADERYSAVSVLVLYFLNAVFFILFFIRSFLFYFYTRDALRLEALRKRTVERLSLLPLLFAMVLTITSAWNKSVFYIDFKGYHNGPFYSIVHYCFAFYVLLSVVIVLINCKLLKSFTLYSLIGYNAILAGGMIARILWPKVLVMDTACMLATVVIYLSFENPDLYQSDRGTAFNMRGFSEVMQERLISGTPYRVLAFILRDYNDERDVYGGGQMDQGIVMITQYLAQEYQDEIIFYLRSGCFAILGTESMDWDKIRQDIYDRFQSPWEADEADLYLSVAFVQIGSNAGLDSADKIIDTMLAALDRAAQSIEAGPNVGMALDSLQAVEQQVGIKRDLEAALEQDRVEVFLQPLVDSNTGDLVAAEALARIRNSEGRLIPPSLFIPIAEKNGHINQLGEQVFEKTCRFISEHDMEKLGLQWINVNLSPIQCMKRDLDESFCEMLKRYHVPASAIRLEITEQVMIDNMVLKRQFQSLENSGFRFVLDDYGSGYSNLIRVKIYPFVSIKLDMEVVWDYFHHRDSLLPTLVRALKQMNFSITAEGIENEEMAEVMREIGCDYLQGFHYSRPLSMEDFIRKYGPKTKEMASVPS